METISQMATTAAKYAFGDSTTHEEPVSGSQGDVAKGEPYDAGNLDPREQQERFGQNLGAGGESGADKRENTGRITTATNATDDAGFTRPQHDLSASGQGASSHSTSSGSGGITTSTNRTTDSGFTSPGQDMGRGGRADAPPSGGLDSSIRGTRDASSSSSPSSSSSTPSSKPGVDRTDNMDSKSKPSEQPSAAQGDNDEAVDVSGPGPRDLSTVARENGGDAGRHAEKEQQQQQPAAAADLPGDQDQGQGQGQGHGQQEKGTGEMYVRSSGLQADGGDFDATKPGAGREADRLMEEKGIVAGGKQEHKAGGGEEGKEKHGLVEKIKEMLHKH